MGGMTNTPSTPSHDIPAAAARRRQIRAMQLLFAGAAAVATLALFGAAQPGNTSVRLADAATPLNSPTATSITNGGGGAGGFIAVDEGVNDQGQSSGDIFQQNAQDQSTASGAGTS